MIIKFKQTVAAIFIYSAVQSCFSEEPRILPFEKWPTTVKATVTNIVSNLSDKNKRIIKKQAKALYSGPP